LNLFLPAEIAENYCQIGKAKSTAPAWKLLILGIMAGLLIAFGSAVTNTATHTISNVSVVRVVSGLLFPFGLGMVILIGAELFTGCCLISISVLDHSASLSGMLRNWAWVYMGNFIGAVLLAAGCAFSGQFDYSNGVLALYTMKIAVGKCAIPFGDALVRGIFCNVLVCLGVLCSLSSKDTIGRIAGAYIPVAFFVICGFEHCVANMYYVPAGLFAKMMPQYAASAAAAGLDITSLTWGNFFAKNLLPVTLGNIIGGVAIGLVMWACYVRKSSLSESKRQKTAA